jgi:regulator of protease activity HflC (stomatin/prohibitin superfamily)
LYYGMPQYNVYKQRMDGEAELAQANYSKQTKVQEALAAKDSAQYLAEAEVIRARGVATANKIVADGLGGPEGYLKYLQIQAMQDTKNQVIYVPTESGLPILEANRLKSISTK